MTIVLWNMYVMVPDLRILAVLLLIGVADQFNSIQLLAQYIFYTVHKDTAQIMHCAGN